MPGSQMSIDQHVKNLKRNPGWLEEYKCGCSNVQRYKRELTGYCPQHGESRRYPPSRYPLDEEDTIGLSS